MRAFLNLSVGLKLAASGVVAMVMLGGIVGTVFMTGAALDERVRRQAQVLEGGTILAQATAAAADA